MKQIIIIGKGKGYKDAPKYGETWGVNDLCLRRDVSLVFNMHRSDLISQPEIDYVNKKGVPFITLEEIKGIPSSIRFPIEEMHTEYFTNSLAYMIAYAVHKKATQIHLYGFGLDRTSKYDKQRHNVDYWIGYARGS